MFWIPYASIFVFAVTIVVSIILGYKRGWRSALFISILFLALNGAVIGVCAALYKGMLWDLYKTYFMKNEMKIGSINYDLLSSYYKVRVILVFAGLVSPITYAITFGLYAALKKPLNNYLMPRVKEISSNEKELVYRKNPKPARIVGATISGTTALFAASYFASAVNVMATPRENQNGFNKFNDVLGRIYNFGLAGNTEETKMMSQFLRNVDGQFVKDVQSLIEYDSQKVQFNISRLSELQKELGQYKFLFESEEATKAIFSAVVANVSSASFDVIDFGVTQSQDSNGNTIGTVQTTNRKLDQLNNWIKNNNLAPTNLPAGSEELPIFARRALLERLIGGLSNWDRTQFAMQLKDAKDNVDSWMKEIEKRKGDLSKARRDLSDEITTQNGFASEISKYAGIGTTVQHTTNSGVTLEDGTNPTHDNVMKANQASVSVTRSSEQNTTPAVGTKVSENEITTDALANSLISNGVKSENDLWKEYVRLNNEYIRLKGISDAETIKFNAIRNDKATLDDRVDAARLALEQTKNQITSKTAEITSATSNLKASETKLANDKARESKLDFELVPNKTTELNNANAKLTAATKELDDAKAVVAQKQPVYDREVSNLAGINTNIDNQNKAITAKQAEIKTANDALTALKNKLAGIAKDAPEYAQAAQDVANKDAEVKTLQGELTNLQTQLTNLQASQKSQTKTVNDLKADLDKANDDVTAKTKNKDSAYNTRNNIQEELRLLQQESSAFKTSIPALEQTIVQQTKRVKDLSDEKVALEANKATQEATLANAVKAQSDFVTSTTPIQGPSGTTHDYGYNEGNRINNQKILATENARKAAQAAQDNFNNKKTEVNGYVHSATENLASLAGSNTKIDSFNKQIDTLLNYNRSLAFNVSTDNADWNKTDDQSIYYAEQTLAYWQNKVSQRQTIADNMHPVYDSLKAELIVAFGDYTIPQGR